ncbi:MAG: hypothetical protein ABF991_00220 [Liquorilactobacillus hordei]|uniref:hypothetical protein n=1 Tax=Liquorilactobacillus hordei TaxID=468911 RepID=UPI0039EB0551
MGAEISKLKKCYYCNKDLEEKDLVTKPVPLVCKNGKVRNYNRSFHVDCVKKFVNEHEDMYKRKQENNVWLQVGEYFKMNILGLDDSDTLPKFAVQRLLGLRTGNFTANGTNTRTIKKGYSFDTILATMKVANIEIQQALKRQNFNDDQHLINFAIFIINKHIASMDKRLRKINKMNEKTEEIKVEKVQVADYVKKGTGKRKFDFV